MFWKQTHIRFCFNSVNCLTKSFRAEMREIIIQDVHSVCRTCLQELGEISNSRERFSLRHRKDLEKLLMSCISMELIDNIELPEFVCHSCYDQLLAFYNFCSKSTESICILSHILADSKQDQKDKVQSLDNEQGSESKAENFKCAESPKKPQSCTENTAIKILQEPAEFLAINEKVKIECLDEIKTEVDIDLSDIEPNARSCLSIASYTAKDSLEYLEIGKESQQEDGQITVKSPVLLDEKCATDSEQFSETFKNLSENKRSKRSRQNKNKISNNTPAEQSPVGISKTAGKFQCEQCPRRCFSLETYEAHLRTHQGLKPFLCKECNHTFNKASHYRRHVRELHGPVSLTFICSFEGCGKIFSREGSYETHCRLKHNPIYANREPKSFVCEDCGKTFRNKAKLNEHRYKHLPIEEHPYQCDVCGKRYRSSGNYKEHLLRHAGIKNFVCTYCGAKKTTKTELRLHINYHTKEKQWPCSKCSSVFNSQVNLGKHDRIVHKRLRPYACTYCDKRFGKQDTWKNHEMRHTGEKPYGCDLCGKRFIQAVALRVHMKSHNTENSKNSPKSQAKEPSTLVEETFDPEVESVDVKINGTEG